MKKIENSTNCCETAISKMQANVDMLNIEYRAANSEITKNSRLLHHTIYPFIAWELEVHNFQWLCKLIFYLTFRHQVSIYLRDNFFLSASLFLLAFDLGFVLDPSHICSLISLPVRSELTFFFISLPSSIFHACLLRLQLTASITSHIHSFRLRFLILP